MNWQVIRLSLNLFFPPRGGSENLDGAYPIQLPNSKRSNFSNLV